MNKLQLTIARFKSESPSYFQSIQKFGIWLTTASGAGFGAIKMIPDSLPGWVSMTLSYMLVAGAVLAGTAALTTTDSNLREDVVTKNDKEATDGK